MYDGLAWYMCVFTNTHTHTNNVVYQILSNKCTLLISKEFEILVIDVD